MMLLAFLAGAGVALAILAIAGWYLGSGDERRPGNVYEAMERSTRAAEQRERLLLAEGPPTPPNGGRGLPGEGTP